MNLKVGDTFVLPTDSKWNSLWWNKKLKVTSIDNLYIRVLLLEDIIGERKKGTTDSFKLTTIGTNGYGYKLISERKSHFPKWF